MSNFKSSPSRKLLLCVAVSLDGFIEGPNGEYDWCLTDQDYGFSALTKRIDAIFMGRKSYDMAKSIEMPSGQNPWEGIKTYVFSKTEQKLGSNYELVTGDIVGEVNKIKSSPGKDIWLWGGASLTRSLMDAGLVDELQLAVHPILLGSGKLLFPDDKPVRTQLQLIDSRSYSSGLVYLTYDVVK